MALIVWFGFCRGNGTGNKKRARYETASARNLTVTDRVSYADETRQGKPATQSRPTFTYSFTCKFGDENKRKRLKYLLSLYCSIRFFKLTTAEN